MSDILFGRRIRVVIYKQGLTSEELQKALSEDVGNQQVPSQDTPTNESEKGSGILSFEIDENLPIEFEVTKTLDNSGKSNSASLRIYGISDSTAAAMGYQMLTCKISVGYRGQPLTPIFLGDIISASYKRGSKGQSSYADFEMSQSYLKLNTGVKFSQTFPRDTELSKVFQELITYFDVDFKFLTADADTKEIIEKKLPYGLSVDGSLAECLQKILKPFGFKWHINDANQVEVFKDDVFTNTDGKTGKIQAGKLALQETPESETQTSTGLRVYELDSNSGLIDMPYLETESVTNRLAEVKVDVPVKNSKTGKTRKKTIRPKVTFARQVVNFKTLLIPDIQPSTIVKLHPIKAQNLAGLYGIISVKYKGATFGNDWYCECVGISTEKEA